jgi:transposase
MPPVPATRRRPTSPRRSPRTLRPTQGAGSNDKKSSASEDREAFTTVSEIYKQRNVVERCINKHKQFRAVATRCDKREYIFAGTVASIRIWLRDPAP